MQSLQNQQIHGMIFRERGIYNPADLGRSRFELLTHLCIY